MTQQGNLTSSIGGKQDTNAKTIMHWDHREPAESLVLRGENLLMPVSNESCFNSSTIIHLSILPDGTVYSGSELMATVGTNSSVACELPGSGIAITEAERAARI